MKYNDHSTLKNTHAFLSASKYHWTNYDEGKIIDSYLKHLATVRGTELHEFASTCIRLKQKLPKSKKSLNSFVNDAIGFRMESELVLYFSDNAFGTADALCFRDNTLRIHDLKTGISPTSMRQLEVYAALFCLEYDEDPEKIDIELRKYQNSEIEILNPDPSVIRHIMDKFVRFDAKINQIKSEELED